MITSPKTENVPKVNEIGNGATADDVGNFIIEIVHGGKSLHNLYTAFFFFAPIYF